MKYISGQLVTLVWYLSKCVQLDKVCLLLFLSHLMGLFVKTSNIEVCIKQIVVRVNSITTLQFNCLMLCL